MESVILQIDKKTFNTILSISRKNGINLNQYVLKPAKKRKIDETEYLLATEANRKALLEAINQKEYVEMEYVNGSFREKK